MLADTTVIPAVPSINGLIKREIRAGSICPSPSSLTITSAPLFTAYLKPSFVAPPTPRFDLLLCDCCHRWMLIDICPIRITLCGQCL
jgi:hypothetical protein